MPSSNKISPDHATALLMAHPALAGVSQSQAALVVRHMKPLRAKAGATLLREGEHQARNFMLLVLEGEVRVESYFHSDEALVLEKLKAGSLLGELGILDDGLRAATCVAATDVLAAMLTREALLKLVDTHPAIGCRLAQAISHSIAQRLRETLRRLKVHVRMNKKFSHQMDMLMASQARARATPDAA